MNDSQRSHKRGHFVAFDGIDGCGKSTQVAKLAADLTEAGIDVMIVRDPGTTEFGKTIRELLLSQKTPLQPDTQAMLFAAVRRETCEVAAEHIRHGGTVIADRWTMSTVVYQGLVLNAAMPLVRELVGTDGCPLRPNKYFLLDVPAEAALMRRPATDDRYESSGIVAARMRRAGFMKLTRQSGSWKFAVTPVVVLNGNRDKDEVAQDIRKHLPLDLQTALAAHT